MEMIEKNDHSFSLDTVIPKENSLPLILIVTSELSVCGEVFTLHDHFSPSWVVLTALNVKVKSIPPFVHVFSYMAGSSSQPQKKLQSLAQITN